MNKRNTSFILSLAFIAFFGVISIFVANNSYFNQKQSIQSKAEVDSALELPPDLYKFASDTLSHAPTDTFSAPVITNFRGQVQASNDIMGFKYFTVPPYNTIINNYNDPTHSQLYIQEDGQPLVAFNETNTIVSYKWYPDKIVRTMEYKGLTFQTEMMMSHEKNAVLQTLAVKNTTDRPMNNISFVLKLYTGVEFIDSHVELFPEFQKADKPKRYAITRYDPGIHAFVSTGDYFAYSVQGTDLQPASYGSYKSENELLALAPKGFDNINAEHSTVAGLQYKVSLNPGATWNLRFTNIVFNHIDLAPVQYSEVIKNFDQEMENVHNVWIKAYNDAFTPGNTTFSGYLPILKTRDSNIERIYYTAVIQLLSHRRIDTKLGTIYITLYPEYAMTTLYPWDIQFFSPILAKLDPEVLRANLEMVMNSDIHTMYAIDYITGGAVGNWYGANDFALFQSIYDYLRYTGDMRWLDKQVGQRTVTEHLYAAATAWKIRKTSKCLADYGNNINLLEVVPTYEHEIASLNAANAWMNKTLSTIYERQGNNEKASELKSDASCIIESLQDLYVKGKGYWRTKNGTTSREVRHVYDYVIAMDTIFNELSIEQRQEMTNFVLNELLTPTWMHALSPNDAVAYPKVPNASYIPDPRPDHQSTGSYPAWPALTLIGFYKNNAIEEALNWMGANGKTGIATITRQGPFGMAHHHGGQGSRLDAGGGARATRQEIMAWSEGAGTTFARVIEEGIFGVDATLYDGLKVNQKFGSFDPGAYLLNLSYQGKNYRVAKDYYISLGEAPTSIPRVSVTLEPKSSAIPLLNDKTISGDYDGDGKQDIALWRKTDGSYHILFSSNNKTLGISMGQPGDIAIPGKYFSSDKTDIAVYTEKNHKWSIRTANSAFADLRVIPWGDIGDIPTVADFDGDGRDDIAVFRPNNGTWYILQSQSDFDRSKIMVRQWGAKDDYPLARDFDADGKADLGLFRPSDGTWAVLTSSSGYEEKTSIKRRLPEFRSNDPIFSGFVDNDGKIDYGYFSRETSSFKILLSSRNWDQSHVYTKQWAQKGDVPIVKDFDGDTRIDLGFFRSTDSSWQFLLSSKNYDESHPLIQTWGVEKDVFVPYDYDGDKKTDTAVYRSIEQTWYIHKSSTGEVYIKAFGLPTDETL